MNAEKHLKSLVLLGMCLALLAGGPQASAGDLEPSAPPAPTMKTLDEVEPRIPIPGSDTPAPDIVINESGSYYLTGDRHCSAFGLIIDANDVTVDLMGYSLIGPGPGSNIGILLDTPDNVEIRNGTVRDFGVYGIYDGSISGSSVRLIDLRVISNAGYGIILSGKSNMLKGCTVSGNGDRGISMGYAASIIDNTVYKNGGPYGIYANYASTVTGNTVYDNNGTGIFVNGGTTVTGNTVRENGGDGIWAGYGSMVTGNTVTYNTGDGIEVAHHCSVVGNHCHQNGLSAGDGAGIHATGTNNRIDSNNVIYNDRGIDVDDVGNFIVRNSAADNSGGNNYDIVAGNDYGAIQSGLPDGFSGADTNYNPWANFSF